MKEPFSGNRVINIYLPNDYNERRKKYPVLYMFDGHNLFFDEEAAFGKSWGMKEYLEDNDTQLIVVGIQCSFEGNERMSEYSPYDLNYNRYSINAGICFSQLASLCSPPITTLG